MMAVATDEFAARTDRPAGWRRPLLARRYEALIAVALAVVVAVPFVPVLANGFVYWDDDVNFFHNPYLRGLGVSSTAWAWGTTRLGVYQPLAWMLLEAEYSVWGMRAGGYHLTSLALHALNTLLLARLLVALLVRRRGEPRAESGGGQTVVAALLAAACFAVHPLRVETVAWASCQPYLPCALFALLAMLAYLHAHPAAGPAQPRWVLAAWLLYAAALLCKAAAVGVAVVFVVLDIYPLGRTRVSRVAWSDPTSRRALVEKVPFALLALAFAIIAIWAREPGQPAPSHPGGAVARVAKTCYGLWFYVVQTIVPTHLALDQPLPRTLSAAEPRFLVPIVATLVLVAVLVLMRRRWAGVAAAVIAYAALLAPTLGIAGMGDNLAAARYGYIPLMALTVLLGAALEPLVARRGAYAVGAACLLPLAGLGVVSWQQCRAWGSTETLFARAAAVHGDDATAHANLGAELLARGALDDAERALREALRLDPRQAAAHSNLALLLARRGELREAEQHFRDAVRHDPQFADAQHGYGVLLTRLKRWDEAEHALSEALRLRPEYVEAWISRGRLALDRGQLSEAEADFAAALRLDPNDVQAYCGQGTALDRRGRLRHAAAAFLEALRRDPDCAEAHAKLGTILARQGQTPAAIVHLTDAVRLAPDQPNAHLNLALALASQGQTQRAAREFARVLQLRPDDPRARAGLDALPPHSQ